MRHNNPSEQKQRLFVTHWNPGLGNGNEVPENLKIITLSYNGSGREVPCSQNKHRIYQKYRLQMRVTVDVSKNTMRERGTLITHNVTGRNIARKQERNHSCAA